MMRKYSALTLFYVFSLPATAASLPQALSVPGGIAQLRLGSASTPAPEVYYQQHRVLVIQDQQQWLALVGIPLETTPGTEQVSVKSGSGTHELAFSVAYKEYPAQHLTIKNKRMVTPEPEDTLRIKADLEAINQAITTWSDNAQVDTSFIPPVEGRISGVFGSRRFFNGQAKNPHSGLDLAAPAGTPIKAPADATVISTGNYYFNGNAVFLDHGQGFITGYFHMTRIAVQPGQRVKSGDIVGTVGATGRVTGPHLHWNAYLNSTKIDPALLIPDDIPRLQAKNHK